MAVVRGRTRSLVERFERRDLLNCSGDLATDSIAPSVSEADKTPAIIVSLSDLFLKFHIPVLDFINIKKKLFKPNFCNFVTGRRDKNI